MLFVCFVECLFMMIGLTLDDRAGPVYLFRKHESYHLVREGHLRQRQLFVGTGIDGRRETVGTSYDEDEPSCRVPFPFEPLGELDATELLAVLVEQYHRVRRLRLLEYQITLGCLLLFLRQTLRVLQLRDGHDLERHVVTNALHIVTDACLEMLVGGLTHEYQ